jgi:hypothetical protein
MVVWASADKIGEFYSVSPVLIDSLETREAMGFGVVSTMLDATHCEVKTHGIISGVYGGLIPGSQMFINTNSMLRMGPPSRPISGFRYWQVMAYAISAGDILVQVKQPMKVLPYSA